MAQRVIVAGGAGFLGSHLCDRLLARGLQVVCIDNLQTGRLENLQAAHKNPDFTFLQHDVTHSLPASLRGPWRYICNLACAASPPRYQRDPIHTLMTCVVGTEQLLRLARSAGATFLQASTSEIYGDPDVHPQPETYRGAVNCTGPRACYDEGKRAAEALCFDYQRTHGTAVRVARIFNTYGPRMDPADGRVVSTFITQALAGEPLTIFGQGQQTRSFCYVDDLLDGMLALLDSSVTGPVNLGNPTEMTVAELAGLVLHLTESASTLRHEPLPPDDPRQRRPLIDRARQELGWEPRTTLLEGLQRTIAALRSSL